MKPNYLFGDVLCKFLFSFQVFIRIVSGWNFHVNLSVKYHQYFLLFYGMWFYSDWIKFCRGFESDTFKLVSFFATRASLYWLLAASYKFILKIQLASKQSITVESITILHRNTQFIHVKCHIVPFVTRFKCTLIYLIMSDCTLNVFCFWMK